MNETRELSLSDTEKIVVRVFKEGSHGEVPCIELFVDVDHAAGTRILTADEFLKYREWVCNNILDALQITEGLGDAVVSLADLGSTSTCQANAASWDNLPDHGKKDGTPKVLANKARVRELLDRRTAIEAHLGEMRLEMRWAGSNPAKRDAITIMRRKLGEEDKQIVKDLKAEGFDYKMPRSAYEEEVVSS